MSRSRVERRLTQLGSRLRKLRDELAVIDEQLAQLASEADDARLRALVSETPVAEREHCEAERHADVMRRRREEVAATVGALEGDQDKLLDQLTAEPS